MGDKVISYFVVAGLGGKEEQQPLKKTSDPHGGNMENAKNSSYQPPITDVVIINRSAGEAPPPGYTCVEKTPLGSSANLNAGAIRCSEMYICYRRGLDRPPLVDIGVLYEGKERLMPGCEIIFQTPYGRPANVNNQSNVNRIFLLFRRAELSAPANSLAVADLCVMNSSKGESPPHTFCQIPKTLNRGLVGSNVFVCYKKSMLRPSTLSYEGQILARFPPTDHPGFPLPAQVPLFCLPLGSVIESWPVQAETSAPVFSRFVLTGADGLKVYGASVSFYEPYPEDQLSLEQRRHLGLPKSRPDPARFPPKLVVQTSKCICVLSKFPFYDAFRKFLSFLYRFSVTGPHSLPIERHITHLINELPFPSQQRPRILYPLGKDMICLEPPEDSHLQPSGACYRALLRNLGPDNCLNLLLSVLVEQKVVIHSLRPDVVTMVAEAAANMIFPFHWQCPYIPLCPLDLSDVLFAPLPFIVGVDSRYFDLFEPPSDVICFDLDTNTIFMPEDKKFLNFKTSLPKRASKMLRATLQRLYLEMQDLNFEVSAHDSDDESDEAHLENIDQNFRRKRQEQRLQLAIQEAFLRFMGMLLKGYGTYLLPVKQGTSTSDPSTLFDVAGFLKSREKAHLKFYSMMLSTQAFSRFLEERSFVSHKDASLAFFDDCVEKLDAMLGAEEDVRLIDTDEVGDKETVRTVFVPPPDDKGLPQGMLYSYHAFPNKLNVEYFAQTETLFVASPPSSSSTASSDALPSSSSAACLPPIVSSTTFSAARRSRQEIRAAQKSARADRASPRIWAKCLLSHVISLWFVHAPAFVKNNDARATKNVRFVFEVMEVLLGSDFVQVEELGFRILMQLCGIYGLPVLAVKVMVLMKTAGIQPNAITYGLYNKAILESKHDSERNSAYHLWRKLSHVIMGVAQFKRLSQKEKPEMTPSRPEGNESLSQVSLDAISRDSADSGGFADGSVMTSSRLSPASPLREDFRPAPRLPKFPDVERASTGGSSDRGYASMTKEEAREIASSLASPELAARDPYVCGDALEFPLTGGIGAASAQPVLEEIPLDASSEQSPPTPAEDEVKGDSVKKWMRRSLRKAKTKARTKVNEISPALANAAQSISQSASSGLQGAVSVGSNYYEAAKPILQTSLEVASAMVIGGNVPSSASLAQMGPAPEETSSRKVLTRSQTVGVMELSSREATPSGDSSRDSPRLPRTRLGSIVKIKPRRSLQSDDSQSKDLETIAHINESAGLLLTSQPMHQSRFSQQQHRRQPPQQRQQQQPKAPSPDSPGRSRRFAPSVDELDRRLLDQLVIDDPRPATSIDVDGDPFEDSPSQREETMAEIAAFSGGASIDAWGPWMTHDEYPPPPTAHDSLLDSSTVSSTPPSSIPRHSLRNGSSSSSSAAHSQISSQTARPIRVIDDSHFDRNQLLNSPMDGSPTSSSAVLSKLPPPPSSTPLKLPPPPAFTSRRCLPLPPHSSENDLLSVISSSPSAVKAKRSPISSSMEGNLDGCPRSNLDESPRSGSKLRSRTRVDSDHFASGFQPLTPSASADSFSTASRRGQPQANPTSPSSVYGDSFNTPARSIHPLAGFDEPSPLVGSLMSFATNAASSFTSRWSGIKNSLSTPSRLGISGEDLSSKSMDIPSGEAQQQQQQQQQQKETPRRAPCNGENLLGGAAQEFEGAEGLSPPKSSRITGAAASRALAFSTPMGVAGGFSTPLGGNTPKGTPSGTPHKPISASARALGVFGSLTSIASYGRTGDPEMTEVTSLDSDLFGETLTASTRVKSAPNGDETAISRRAAIAENGAWKITSLLNPESGSGNCEEAIALDISISSCTICQNCSAGLYDEEIMGGWSPDDSNLSTKCPFCACLVVPTLTIRVRDFRLSPRRNAKSLGGVGHKGLLSEDSAVSGSTPNRAKGPPNDLDTSTQEEMSCLSPPPPSLNLQKSPERRRAISECNTLSSSSSTPGVNIDVADDVFQFQDTPSRGPQDQDRSLLHSEPVIVPYLSPLTLRKEVENILETEGDLALGRAAFLQDHPICFWNLLFYFKRVDLVSHLPAFLLHDKKIWGRNEKVHPTWLSAGMKNVSIRPLWDHQESHDITSKPLYSLWNTGEPASFLNALVSSPVENYQSLMKELLASIACNDLLHPIRLVNKMREESFSFKSVPLALSQLSPLSMMHKQGNKGQSSSREQRSLYREILFLTICAYGPGDVDFKAFDWKYKQAIELAERDTSVKASLRPQDGLPGISALWCRKYFGILPLK